MAHFRLAVSPASCVLRNSSSLGAFVPKRASHDLSIHKTTGRPIIQSGPGGRHSNTGSVATVFGCTGFLGRYIVHKLAKKGTQVVVPYRDEDEKRHLKVMGDLGQIVPLEWDVRNDNQIEECVRHSDVVINLVGRDYETKNFSFHDIHVDGARRMARIAYLSGVSRFIHLSHINADFDSPSAFYRTKAIGESAVQDAFAGATIVRPSTIFGHEDRFLNDIASKSLSYRFNEGKTITRPVHSHDVAEAVSTIARANSTIGDIFSLVGPKTYTYNDLYDLVRDRTGRSLTGVNVPKSLAIAATAFYQHLFFAKYSPDLIKRRFIDDKAPAPGTKTFADLNITPEELEDLAIMYLRWYRGPEDSAPVDKKGIQYKNKPYHVVE